MSKARLLTRASLVVILALAAMGSATAADWEEMSSGTGENLCAVWGLVASEDVFAVGEAGTVLHYDEGSWGPLNPGTDSALYGVWGSSATDVYMVGQAGLILNYDGFTWTSLYSGEGTPLKDVTGTSASDVYAVGADGLALHYDGDSWTDTGTGTEETLNGAWAGPSGKVFAAGTSGTLLDYDGTWHQSIYEYPTHDFLGVSGASLDFFFAVGQETPTKGLALFGAGGAWSGRPMTIPTCGPLYGVWASPEDEAFAVGDGGAILHYKDDTWSSMGGVVSPVSIGAGNAEAGPGEQDDVRISLHNESIEATRIDFTLSFDQSVLQQPEETDISAPLFDSVTADVTQAGEVSVTATAVSAIVIGEGQAIAFVTFTVQPDPSTLASELTITGEQVLDAVGDPIPTTPWAPGAFAVLWKVVPQDPEVSTGEYLHFTINVDLLTPTWSLTSAPSNGQINPSNGIYRAGGVGATVDEVMATAGSRPATTTVTVSTTPRPPGTVGPPTSMDVDGGGLSLADVIHMLKFVVGVEIPTPEQVEAGDFDVNGAVGLGDVINALRIVVGLPPIL